MLVIILVWNVLVICIIVSYPVISCYITLHCFNFVCIVMCLPMFTVVIVKGGQHWWALAFSGSLPLYFYECLCIVLFYLANKVSSSSCVVWLVAMLRRLRVATWLSRRTPVHISAVVVTACNRYQCSGSCRVCRRRLWTESCSWYQGWYDRVTYLATSNM